ncbi:hypothetical protein COM96_18805 [Bacillus cereus]|uniref:Uncharacterized protein n=2 Tax=Bacillus cereus TaxID=1396 RepID=A0A2A7HUG5_BACCE|nr:hypothetical protein COM96_18805 [Bacillus cereus]
MLNSLYCDSTGFGEGYGLEIYGEPQEQQKLGTRVSWSPDICLTITIKPANLICTGYATPINQKIFSSECGEVNACYSAFIFDIWFHVDISETPRPTPFTMPKLTLDLLFTDIDGVVKFETHGYDPNPSYQGAGNPLQPNFGKRFTIISDKEGRLEVNLELHDSATGKIVRYADSILCTRNCA